MTSSSHSPGRSPAQLALAPNRLRLTVMPTERCNFRCTYCYEDFELGRMPREVVEGVKAFLTRRAPGLDHLLVTWFGGEPLLAADLVEEIQEHVLALGRRHPRLAFSSRMTTNGFLLAPDLLRRLVALGVDRYQISVDGPPVLHNRKRKRRGGAGTFDRIWANLEAARELDLDFEILLRIHIDRDTLPGFPALLDLCRQSFGGDPRFRLLIRETARLGGPRDAEIPVLEGAEKDEALARLRRLAGQPGPVRKTGLGVEAGDGSTAVCYAAAANAYVIRSNGDVAKCTVAFRHPNNRVGRLRPEGVLELDDAKMMGWLRGHWSGDAQQLSCPMHGYADGAKTRAVLPVLSR